MKKLPKIIVVCGPTGVGKTRFAIKVAKRFSGEIVGADSMQIYRYMDIGTAKPTAQERAAVIHHMVDILEPGASFDAAAYGDLAHSVMQDLLTRKIVPFVVGGTGLYIKALIYGLFDSTASDPAIRKKLHERLAREGNAALHAELSGRDPRAAERIHANDTFRIVRALEVIETTGRSMTSHQLAHGFVEPRYNVLTIGLTLSRETLYKRINQRVDSMLAEGLKDEVEKLLALGMSPELKSMQSLGYRHMVDYLQGRLSWEEAVRTLKRDHRRYAKRQLTWFGALDGVHWLMPDQDSQAGVLIERFLDSQPQDL